MVLKQLNLTNFRNYSALNLDFDNRPTIFIGNNAQGKSNILEAIYLLSTTKSLRVDNEMELIKGEEEFTKVEGFILPNNSINDLSGETELLIILNRAKEEVNFRKKVLVNGVSRRALDFIGNLPSIIFYPSDINMVTGSPSLRRWHLDLGLAQVDSSYKKALTLYEQFLTSRNRVLKRIKEGKGRLDELDYWTNGLLEQGKIVSEKRIHFFEFINNLKTPLGEFIFKYKPSEVSLEKLKQTTDREVAASSTLIGPHRDDFEILLNQRSMARFGSRGEQRTTTLAFKLAQLEYMAKILNQRPILLLDDVFSELDADHRAHVAQISLMQQTIISTVELENVPQDFLNSARILKVENGSIISS